VYLFEPAVDKGTTMARVGLEGGKGAVSKCTIAAPGHSKIGGDSTIIQPATHAILEKDH
jgi:hypothetical protein